MYAIGVTDRDVAQLTNRAPLQVDLADVGDDGLVVIFHGPTAEDLREQLAAVLTPEQMVGVTSTLDQIGAREREQANP